jgi:hypothetical protein
MTADTQTLDTSLSRFHLQKDRFISFSDAGRHIEESRIQNEERLISAKVSYNEAIGKLHQTILDFIDDELEMDSESTEIACEFLKKLSHHPNLLNAVSISADPEGKTVLRWKSEKKGVLSMSVGANRVLYYASTIEGNESHGKEFFDNEIPSAIWAIMQSL